MSSRPISPRRAAARGAGARQPGAPARRTRAMAFGLRVLCVVAATGAASAETGAEVAELLFALPERTNTTLFLVTHEETLARRCKRIVKLKDGAIVADT